MLPVPATVPVPRALMEPRSIPRAMILTLPLLPPDPPWAVIVLVPMNTSPRLVPAVDGNAIICMLPALVVPLDVIVAPPVAVI